MNHPPRCLAKVQMPATPHPACLPVQGKLGNWRLSMCACTGLLAISAALFLIALLRSDGAVSYREVAEVESGLLACGGEEDEEEGGGAGDSAAADEPGAAGPRARGRAPPLESMS